MNRMLTQLVFLAVMTASLFQFPCFAFAADKSEIQAAIAKGAAHIRSTLGKKSGAAKSFAFLTLLKSGEPSDSPLMQEAVQHVRDKIKDGSYSGAREHIYEAAIDITLLADLDGEKFKPDIQIIASYILEHQNEAGWWTYPPPHTKNGCIDGDVSITHYACLGLWAAARAGIPIDAKVWTNVLNWKSRCHNKDGGYTYWPGTAVGVSNGNSSLNMTVNSVGTMYIAMINLDPKRVPKLDKGIKAEKPTKGEKSENAEANAPAVKKRTGVVEAVDLDSEEDQEASKMKTTGQIPSAAISSSMTAFRWVTVRFVTENRDSPFSAYYYYSLERMGALLNITKIGDHDWYNECADVLISKQNADGSWAMTTFDGPENDTCFAVLFLSRSTGKILKRTNMEPPVGGGLLSGGRGLPDDLSELDANGNPKKKKAEKSSLDDLLAALQDSDGSNLEETQTELIQMVQLGDKKQLVGQKDKLVTLIAQPDPEVRRTAIWAIGRTGDLSLAKYAILGLDDPDLGVAMESHLALCWTARKPNAFKLPLNPLADLPADAPEDQKAAAVESWRRQALRLWGEWYLRNRPYADRGDEFETNLRNRLLQLK